MRRTRTNREGTAMRGRASVARIVSHPEGWPSVVAIAAYRLAHALWPRNRWIAELLSVTARCLTGIEIHPGAVIGTPLAISHGAGVVIGATAHIGAHVTILQQVTLGNRTAAGRIVTRDGRTMPTLEDGVLVGAGAKVLGPVTVGKGASIGANAVVLIDIPEGATAVGVPAKVL